MTASTAKKQPLPFETGIGTATAVPNTTSQRRTVTVAEEVVTAEVRPFRGHDGMT